MVIHAGTHKTASSYIQSRIAANRSQLKRLGVSVSYPSKPSRKHKPLATALARGRWRLWGEFLRGVTAGTDDVLLSAEQFTQPLAKQACLNALVDCLELRGFRLRVVLFLRDQPDYINARYVHSSRRLYHYQSFGAYVEAQLAERRHIYDYNYLFRHLSRHPRVDSIFLPYGSALGDPYVRMMAALGWTEPAEGWAPADPQKGNVQPGCRGVWLAHALGQRLEALGLQGRSLVNTGAVVRRISEQQGWQDDRYCGFDPAFAAMVAAHYAEGNDAFARRAWGCRWRERVPAVPMERREYHPPSAGEERQQLDRLVEQALRDLAARNRHVRRAIRTRPLR